MQSMFSDGVFSLRWCFCLAVLSNEMSHSAQFPSGSSEEQRPFLPGNSRTEAGPWCWGPQRTRTLWWRWTPPWPYHQGGVGWCNLSTRCVQEHKGGRQIGETDCKWHMRFSFTCSEAPEPEPCAHYQVRQSGIMQKQRKKQRKLKIEK